MMIAAAPETTSDSNTNGQAGSTTDRSSMPANTNQPTFRFHDLRHTCATLLLLKNIPAKVVQEMLGHATITQRMDTYSHVLPTMQDAATEAMESTLF